MSPRRGMGLERHAGAAGLIGIMAAILLLVWGFFSPVPVLQGWLIAYVFWSAIAIGGLVLVLIHVLTAGRWLSVVAPPLVPAAGVLPLFAALFVPLGFGLALLYPWIGDPTLTSPSVARLYLNPPAYFVRTAIALAGWSLLAILVIWTRVRVRPLVAGLGLAFHGLAISVIAVDWVLSVDPRFTSTDFGANIAITQLAAALAWAALVQLAPAEPGREGDLASLLLATLLGAFYLAAMQYVVSWYGDLPEKASWYLRRSEGGWVWLAIAAFGLTGPIPILALMPAAIRRNAARMRWVGAIVLLGVLLRVVWLIAPEFELLALPAALLGLLAIGGLWLALAYGPLQPRPAVRPEAVHGA